MHGGRLNVGGEALKIIDSLMLQCSETIIKSISKYISIDPEETRSNVKLQLFSQSLGGPSNLPLAGAEIEVNFGNFSPHSSSRFFVDSRLLIPYSS